MAPTSNGSILHLPGTTLEGGGQLLRLSIGLAALTATPVRISAIRGNRSGGGGIKGQHLASIAWLAAACGARVRGMQKKSQELVFIPGKADVNGEDLPQGLTQAGTSAEAATTIDIGSPGAVTLVLQAILPYLLFTPAPGPVSVTVLGGTNVSNSPSIDYVSHVLLPMLALVGLGDRVRVRLNSRGWSTGRNEMGSVTVTVEPLPSGAPSPAFILSKRGDIARVEAFVLAPRSLHDTFDTAVRRAVVNRRGLGVLLAKDDLVVSTTESGHPKRLYLLLVAVSENGHRLARDWLWGANLDFRSMKPGKGKKGSSRGVRSSHDEDREAEKTIDNAVDHVVAALADELAYSGCVDEHMRDQLVVFQTLAAGRCAVDGGRKDDAVAPISLHAQTAQWVAHEMLGVEFDEDGGCEGVAFEPAGDLRGTLDDDAALAAQVDRLHV